MRLVGSTTISLKTVMGLNAREHHMARAARAKSERKAAYWAAHAAVSWRWVDLLRPENERFVVKLTRASPATKEPDDDNLQGALKHVRDGVAERLKVDDGDKQKVRWVYASRIREPYAVVIEVFVEGVNAGSQ